jgi:putative endonuclease
VCYDISESGKKGERMDRKRMGQVAEEAAVHYLKHQGYQILERNYRSPLGEIDIIAEDRDTLVFIEVRSRQGTRFGLPQETVNWAKQQKVKRMATHYLKAKNAWKKACRFDVVGILFNEEGEVKSLELIRDAF